MGCNRGRGAATGPRANPGALVALLVDVFAIVLSRSMLAGALSDAGD
jgi:hypothetical protein